MTARMYFAKVLDGMAKGLFASLIVGIIIRQLGAMANIGAITAVGRIAMYLIGPCIGAGVAFARECGKFTIIASVVNGAIGAGAVTLPLNLASGDLVALTPSISVGVPVGAFVAVIVGMEIGRLIEGRTKFDLLLIPAVAILGGGLTGLYTSPLIVWALNKAGVAVNFMASLQPLPMGILIGIVAGMATTLPISAAALCIGLNIGGLAAGAALAGCCAQMIGFAFMGFRENKIGGILSHGLGTSMLQIPNIIKNPLIWIPPIVASGVCGALSTMLFRIRTTDVGAGMGTSGLVGPLETMSAMGNDILPAMLILYLAVPAAICLIGGEIMRRMNLIKPGDLQI